MFTALYESLSVCALWMAPRRITEMFVMVVGRIFTKSMLLLFLDGVSALVTNVLR